MRTMRLGRCTGCARPESHSQGSPARRGAEARPGRGRPPSWRRVVAVVAVMTLALPTLDRSRRRPPCHPSTAPASAGAAAVCQSPTAPRGARRRSRARRDLPYRGRRPANSLSDDEYVFVKATDFPSGDSMRIALCSLTTSSTDPSCLKASGSRTSGARSRSRSAATPRATAPRPPSLSSSTSRVTGTAPCPPMTSPMPGGRWPASSATTRAIRVPWR